MRPWRRATRRGCPQKARTPRKSFVLSGTPRGRFRPWPRKESSRSDGRLSPTGRADSRTLELRCALLHEGLDSFVNVVRRGDEAEGHRLHLEGRIDGRVATAIQDRLATAGELPHLERLGNVAEGRQVRSGTERTVPGAGHHDTPDGIVSLQLRKGPLELIEDLGADRVQSIGSIDRDRRDMGLRIARD